MIYQELDKYHSESEMWEYITKLNPLFSMIGLACNDSFETVSHYTDEGVKEKTRWEEH